jgi:hypothetical protein
MLLATLLLLVTTIALAQQPATAAQRDAIMQQYLNLPLSFEPNHGQTVDQAKFIARAPGYGLMFERNGVAFLLPGKQQADTVRVSWIGADTKHITGEQPQQGRINYLQGSDAQQWVTDVPTFARVRYSAIYPGIDLVYYGTNRQVEYDLVVAPGADAKQISFRIGGGHAQLRNGELVVKTTNGELRQHAPVVYQDVAGKRQAVAGKYVMLAADRVGFQLGVYDHTKALVIDPSLAYSSYLGGGGIESGQAIAVDSSGRAYVTGLTNSPSTFPRKNAAQSTFGGQGDAYVTKFWATGGGLIYSTYLGGSGQDSGMGIAVDRFGSAYVVGMTKSTDFPTTPGAFQTTNHGGFHDTFVTKLSASGSSLVYSTYLGGSGDDQAWAMTVDSSGRVYVTGQTTSTDYPLANAYQSTMMASGEAFVTRLNASGTGLDYSTYLGGSGGAWGRGIAVDSNSQAYVGGQTQSTDFPTTAGAFEQTWGGSTCTPPNPVPSSVTAGFVTKFSPSGTSLVYSTYVNGCTQEVNVTALAIDSSNRAYITGVAGNDFPTTSGAFKRKNSFDFGGFVTRLAADGGSLSYSTYLGSAVSPNSIAVDASARAWVAGQTNPNATDFPVKNAFQSTSGGHEDGFVMKLWATGGGLIFSSYLGGSGPETANSVRLDGSGNGYITGSTSSTNFPTTSGAYDRTLANTSTPTDAFVTKVNQ